jgi:hypothetical protein
MGKQVFAIGNFGIGEVKQSVLTEAEFQQVFDGTWVLMDGRDITGSDLANLTGNNTLPDARGQFLRGKNNGRNDGSEDPEGERNLGASQSDSFGSHDHGGGFHGHALYSYTGTSTSGNLGMTNTITGVTGKNSASRGYVSTNGDGATLVQDAGNFLNTDGGSETRPRNIVINYFVKINE